jgi:hypothetical protein
LRPGETAGHLGSSRANVNADPVSADTPTGASRIGPVGPLRLLQSDASGGPLRWVRPTKLGSARIPRETVPDDLPVPDAPSASSGPAALAALRVAGPGAPARLPYATRDSGSDASSPRPPRSIPDAAPPVSAIELRSSFRWRRPEVAGPWRAGALG